jgi:hypothetical protein
MVTNASLVTCCCSTTVIEDRDCAPFGLRGFGFDRIPFAQDDTRRDLFFFLFAHLLGQVAFVAQFFDLVDLGFEPIDVTLFILEQLDQ